MIGKAAILFLFGTTLTSGQLWPHMAPDGAFIVPTKSSGCPSGPEMAPLICKFMQPNMGLQFKPQLIAPTTYIAPLVVERCDSPQLQMDIEIPAPVEEAKPLVIPEPPELPPMTIPKFPVPVIIEAPPAPLHEPCESAHIPVMPVVNIPAAPEIPQLEIHELPQIAAAPEPFFSEELIPEINDNTIEYHPKTIPQPPELPAFIMPEIPIDVMEQGSVEYTMPVAPCLEDELIAAPIPAHVGPLAPLPAAPELPAFAMPELPIEIIEENAPMPAAPFVEDEPILAPIPAPFVPLAPLPAAPELPAFRMPELPAQIVDVPMPVAPCLEDETILANFEPLAPLPAAPELPRFTMPELPIQIVELPMPVAPRLEDEPIPAHFESLAPLPAAPELPTFAMPELPIHVVEQESPMPAAPCLEREPIPFEPVPAYLQPGPEYNIVEYQPMMVPQPPELPAFVMPELPAYVTEPEMPIPPAPTHEDFAVPIVAVPEYIEPLAPMPAAPELPPVSLPEFAIQMERAAPEPIIIPQPPKLAEIKMPELPVLVANEKPAPCESSFVMPNPFYEKLFPSLITIYNEKAKETQNILLPPMEGAYPTPCVYNLVMKHVVPNMLSDNFRSMENIEINPASFVPCS